MAEGNEDLSVSMCRLINRLVEKSLCCNPGLSSEIPGCSTEWILRMVSTVLVAVISGDGLK